MRSVPVLDFDLLRAFVAVAERGGSVVRPSDCISPSQGEMLLGDARQSLQFDEAARRCGLFADQTGKAASAR